ncbi:COX11 [Candida theae]|uniref:COX11 n=1 Tax=Candida theae TaxID=1198502 RepID=A0AAD5BBW5_9ASCO|nr:COX11 [Candida theae]KAI5953036.1 COX11 [Candida theae]
MIGVIRLRVAGVSTMQMMKSSPSSFCRLPCVPRLARPFHQSVIYKQLNQQQPTPPPPPQQTQSQIEARLEAERARVDKLAKEREERQRYKNRTATYYAASLGIVFLALAFCAVPVYRAICQRTGWGGIPITDSTRFTPDKLIPVDTNKRIRVQFTCQSSGVLPWKFTPLQREVYVVPGETALAFYRAKNMSKEDIIGMATYSIIPENAAAYFNKIQCFCFEEQRLSAGEEVDMPVFFFIDPDFAKDPNMRGIDDVVLHYSFFKAAYSEGELSAVPSSRKVELKAELVQG